MTAIETAKQAQQDRPALPASRIRTVVMVAVTFTLSLLLTGWISHTDEDVLTARMTAHSTTITAQRASHLKEVLAAEGSTIDVGGELVRMSDSQFAKELAAKQREVARRHSQWQESLAKADVDLAWRLRSVNAEILQTRLRISTLLQSQFDKRTEQLAWRDRLMGTAAGFDSKSPDEVFRIASSGPNVPGKNQLGAMVRYEAARNAAEVAKVQWQLCKNRLQELKKLKAVLPRRVQRAFATDAANARWAAAKAELAGVKNETSQAVVPSPAYGTVGKYRFCVGEPIAAGEEIVRIVDESRRFLIVDVPAEKLSRLSPGQTVRLRFPDGELRKGKVAEFLHRFRQQHNGPVVSARINPAGKLWPKIPIGAAVDVVLPGSE